MAKYSKKAEDTIESAMHRFKEGRLKSGSGRKVTSRKQAIAIGISEAREKGAKVPAAKKKSAAASKKSPAKKTGAGKSVSRKSTGRKSSSSK